MPWIDCRLCSVGGHFGLSKEELQLVCLDEAWKKSGTSDSTIPSVRSICWTCPSEVPCWKRSSHGFKRGSAQLFFCLVSKFGLEPLILISSGCGMGLESAAQFDKFEMGWMSMVIDEIREHSNFRWSLVSWQCQLQLESKCDLIPKLDTTCPKPRNYSNQSSPCLLASFDDMFRILVFFQETCSNFILNLMKKAAEQKEPHRSIWRIP